MLKRFIGFLLPLLCSVALAQTTTVTGTLVDPLGNTWSNATITPIFTNAPGIPGPYNWSGGVFNHLPATVITSSGGVYSFTLPSNTAIVPTGSTWVFNVCPNASLQCAVVNLSISGTTFDLGAAITSSGSFPSSLVIYTPIAKAYNVNQIGNCPPINQSGLFYNTTNQTMNVCTSTGWEPFATVGGFPVVTNPSGNQTINQPTNTSFNVNTSGTGCLESNSNCVLTTVTGTPAGTAMPLGTGVLLTPTASQNISQPAATSLSVSNLNGVINPIVCGATPHPSWCSGSDMGGWINQAYAQLGANGGEIDIPSGSYTLTAPIVFGTLQKPALLRCSPGTIFTWSTPNTTATMVTLDWGWTPSGVTQQTPQGGIDGCQFFGNIGTSIGLEMGGVNGGSVGANIQNSMFYMFGTGMDYSNAALSSFLTRVTNSFFNVNTTGVNINNNTENIHFFGGDISENTTAGLSVNNNSADIYLYSVSFDGEGIFVGEAGTGGGVVNVIGCHFENPGLGNTHYITTVGTGAHVKVYGGTMLDDRTGGTGDYFLNIDNGDQFSMIDTLLFTNQSLTSLIFSPGLPLLHLEDIEPIGGGPLFSNGLGTVPGMVSSSFVSGIQAVDLPLTIAFGTSKAVFSMASTGILTVAVGSNNYLLDNAGNFHAPTGYFAGTTTGVSCSGTPTASFASVGGIVTHC